MNSTLRLALASVALFTMVGCAGYQVGPQKPERLAGVSKIAVPTFDNDTLEPRLAVLVTNALIKKLQMDGTYQIVSEDEADAVLRGRITNVNRRQFRSVRTNVLRSRELSLDLISDYSIEDRATGVVLMQGIGRGRTNIVIDDTFQVAKRQGLAVAAERLADNLTSRIANGW